MSWTVTVLRHASGDFTAGGVSSRFERFVLLAPGEAPPETALPLLRLVVRWPDTDREYLHAEPVFAEGERPRGVAGPMAGGNYVWSSDSRFRTGVSKYPVPVHDRFETRG